MLYSVRYYWVNQNLPVTEIPLQMIYLHLNSKLIASWMLLTEFQSLLKAKEELLR